MGHFVFQCTDGSFIGTRKNNGRMYESRVTTTPNLDEARIFNTAPAASNAGNRVDADGRAMRLRVSLETEPVR